MSIKWQLTPHAHLACIGDDAVFLDLRTETYACLPALAADIADLAGGRPAALREELATDLNTHGLIERHATAAPHLRAPFPPRANTSAMPLTAESIRGKDWAAMAVALIDLGIAYRGRPLTQVIAAARRSRFESQQTTVARAELDLVVSSVARWLPFAPLPPKCLLRSFLLLRSLHRQGLNATWVFGVTTWPFRAHCWLQVDDVVLDDDADRVRGFEPIMVV